jgi:hypothetical protein
MNLPIKNNSKIYKWKAPLPFRERICGNKEEAAAH